jgi:hypothetical protein
VYDVFHKVREVEEDIVCPSCGSRRHTRLLSAPSISVSSGEGSHRDEAVPSCATGCCGGACDLN